MWHTHKKTCLAHVSYSNFLSPPFNAFWEEIHTFSHVSLHRPIFDAHWAVCLNANGQQADTSFPGVWYPKPVTRPSSWVFHPIYLSLLPMTRHAEMDTKHRCILTVAAAIHRLEEAYLQLAASISFTWEKGTQPETELETTCPDRSLYSVLTYSPSVKV